MSVPAYDRSLREAARRVRAKSFNLERENCRIFAFGLENTAFLDSLGVEWICLSSDPLVNWTAATDRNPSEDGRVNWGLSHWRHKLECIRAGLTVSEAVIWLDWDCHLCEPLPADFWDRLATGPPFRASLRFYRHRQVSRPGRMAGRYVPHGAWQYFRRDWIDRAIETHARRCPGATDEVGMAYFLDELHDGWIGVEQWAKLYEPDCYDQRHRLRQIIPLAGRPLFRNWGRW